MDGKIWLSDINQKMNNMKNEKGKEKEKCEKNVEGEKK